MGIENENVRGDTIGRDKFQGDSITGNKYEITAYINSIKSGELDNDKLEKLTSLYLRWVFEECSRLPLGALEPNQNNPNEYQQSIRLENVYTALYVTDEINLREPHRKNEEGIAVPKKCTAMSTVISRPHLVILGDPGAGKSTFLSHIGQMFSFPQTPLKQIFWEDELSDWSAKEILPIFIKFKDFAHWIPEDSKGTFIVFLEILRNYLIHNGFSDTIPLILEKIKSEQCILLLDGLDEISDIKQLKTIRQMIQNMVAIFPNNRLLITCRTLTYSNTDWQMNLPVVKLAPLDDSQIKKFIASWYKALVNINRLEVKLGKAKAIELCVAISTFNDLARNPLILTVIALLHSFTGSLPNERARLYAHCVDLMLLRWHQTKNTGNETQIDKGVEKLKIRETEIKRALWEVAYQTHLHQQEEDVSRHLSQGEIMEILQKYIDNDWANAKTLLDYIEKKTGLLLSEGFDKFNRQIYSFPHRTFQEFLAGCYLASQRDFSRQAIQIVRTTESWQEVFLLAIGHLVLNQNDIVKPLDTASALLSASVEKDDWKPVWWAAEVINIVGITNTKQDEVGRSLLPLVCTKLKSITSNPTIPAYARVQIGNLSGKLDLSHPSNDIEPELIFVKGGKFQMGINQEEINSIIENADWANKWYENHEFNQEMPKHIVVLDSFQISKNVITNLLYNNFIIDNGYEKKQFWTSSGWEWKSNRMINKPLYFEDGLALYPNHPVVWISWYEAKAFCDWLGKQTNKNYNLPTEAQWERAAKGMTYRIFPWGNKWNNDITNTAESKINTTAAVGIFPLDISAEGCNDMGGNVREWCLSKYEPYSFVTDERNAITGEEGRVLRGGSFNKYNIASRCCNRFWDDPNYRANNYGFRVVVNKK